MGGPPMGCDIGIMALCGRRTAGGRERDSLDAPNMGSNEGDIPAALGVLSA